MFDFFKRLVAPPAKERTQRPTPKPPKPHRRPLDLSEPIPLPEVIEGNDNTDWDLWQDSVDSQVQPLRPSSRNFPDTTPSQLSDIDPFEKVRRNRDR